MAAAAGGEEEVSVRRVGGDYEVALGAIILSVWVRVCGAVWCDVGGK